MEKNFREVIMNIKEGEVWECGNKIIEMFQGNIMLRITNGKHFDEYVSTCMSGVYKLKRNECTFVEAFEAYENGKEIESLITKTKYLKSGYCEGQEDANFLLGMKEIRGKWYINN